MTYDYEDPAMTFTVTIDGGPTEAARYTIGVLGVFVLLIKFRMAFYITVSS